MAFAVSAWFDPAFERAVRQVWAALRAGGVSAFLADGPYRPHATFGVWQRRVLAEVQERLARLAHERVAFEVRFEQFGAFPGPEPALLLVPTMSVTLAE